MMDEDARQSRFSVACNATGGVDMHHIHTQRLYEEPGTWNVSVDSCARRLDRFNMGILFLEKGWDEETIRLCT